MAPRGCGPFPSWYWDRFRFSQGDESRKQVRVGFCFTKRGHRDSGDAAQCWGWSFCHVFRWPITIQGSMHGHAMLPFWGHLLNGELMLTFDATVAVQPFMDQLRLNRLKWLH